MTTLRAAPVIVGQLTDRKAMLAIRSAAHRIRRDYASAPVDGGSLRKLDGDIWALDEPIGIHTDGTAKGHRVFGVVLINDPGLVLLSENVIYDLPIGTVYHIDGHRRHGALAHNAVRRGQLFGFLAWDVPATSVLQDLLDDLIPSLEAYGRRQPRINVLAPT